MTLGQIVYSSSGRDSGKAFVVVSIEEGYIFIADGNVHRIEKAKKKKAKHVIETELIDIAIKNKLLEGERVSNADLRKVVSSSV